MDLGKFIPALCMLLGLMKPSAAVDSNCNYRQIVKHGVSYYIYNPSFPDYYTGEHSCKWLATADTRLKLNCTIFEILATPNCSGDAVIVKVADDIEYRLCGLSSFVLESISNEMTIQFRSQYNTFGGRFQCELTAIEDDCRCGWKNPNRIVGGVETGINEFPMMAGLISRYEPTIFCGATIITNIHVITAAHCILQYENNVENLAIIIGEHNVLTGHDTSATQVYIVEEIRKHPDYTSKNKYADVAIVKSSHEFTFSMRVGPVCLPFYYREKSFTNDNVTALGWGTLWFGGKKPSVLMKVDLKVIDNNECSEYYNITQNNVCTYSKGKDSCQFDSGGPLLWQNPQTHRVILPGIISYGRTCADNAPGVGTRVSSYLDFILRHTRGYKYCRTL